MKFRQGILPTRLPVAAGILPTRLPVVAGILPTRLPVAAKTTLPPTSSPPWIVDETAPSNLIVTSDTVMVEREVDADISTGLHLHRRLRQYL